MSSTSELTGPLALRPLSSPTPAYESLESKLQQFTRDRFRSLLDHRPSTKRLPGSGASRQSSVAPASEVLIPPRATPDISLRDYVPQAWKIMEPGREFVSNWHIDAISDHLEAVTRGDIKRLIINVPPRHMKSGLVSVCWPTWVWTFMPEHAWLFSSNSHGVATRDSLASRRLIQSPWYQERWGFRFNLTSDQNAKMRYENDKGGTRLITSIGSSLLGEGGDTLVADDINGPDESIDGRQSIADWFDHTWSTRKNDPLNSSMVIIQQRLDMADITGHVLAEGGWVHLCLPARYEKARHCVTVPLQPGEPAWSDPRTEEGELLWPQRWTQELVDQEEKVLKWDFPGQQQQRPAARGGIIFMRQQFKFWHPRGVEAPPVAAETEDGSTVYIESEELPREFHEAIQSWDLSFKDVKSSSYVVGGLWLRHFKTFYLRDMTREHMGFTATLKAIIEFSHRWPMAQRKLIEDKANGPAIMDALKGKLNGVIPVEPDGTKEARAFAVTHLVEGGDVYLPHPVVFPWVNTFLEEVCTFPNAVHDDQVDMMTQALRHFSAPNTLETMRILGL